jgi:CrcB protein
MRSLLIALGAGIGAPLRYFIDDRVKKLHSQTIPIQTLLINTLGSFVLGVAIHRSANLGFLLGTGFAGAFTTWSTLTLECFNLVQTKKFDIALIYLGLTLILGISAAALGARI